MPLSAVAGGLAPTPVLNTYQGPAASDAPRRVMVAPFGENVGAEGAGRTCVEIVGRILRARGLEVTAGDAAPGAEGERLRQAESLGADVAVLGTVTTWTRREVEMLDTWVAHRRGETFVPGGRRVESRVAVAVRVLHVASGRLAYSVLAHWSAPWDGEPEEAAEKLLEAALAGWSSASAKQ
jgi:hypothetical protein